MKFISYIFAAVILLGSNMNSNSTELLVSDPEEQRTAVTQETLENQPAQQTKEATHTQQRASALYSKLEPVLLTSLVCCGLTVCCIVGVPTLIICSPAICVVLLIMAIFCTTYEFYNWLRDPDKWAL